MYRRFRKISDEHFEDVRRRQMAVVVDVDVHNALRIVADLRDRVQHHPLVLERARRAFENGQNDLVEENLNLIPSLGKRQTSTCFFKWTLNLFTSCTKMAKAFSKMLTIGETAFLVNATQRK